jgi:hypothetical protein
MSLMAESIVDGGMDVEKTLGGLRPLEPLHLAFSSPWRHRAGAVVVLTLRWDQRFESAFLQRRVSGELGFAGLELHRMPTP